MMPRWGRGRNRGIIKDTPTLSVIPIVNHYMHYNLKARIPHGASVPFKRYLGMLAP